MPKKAAGEFDDFYKIIGGNDTNQQCSDYLSTGYLPLNKAMSGSYWKGGFPVGRITEVFGGESSGKTLLATMAMKEAQKRDGMALLLDYEHAFDIARAKVLGMSDAEGVWFYKQPETAEQGFQMMEELTGLIRKRFPEKHVCIAVDSVASMPTKLEQAAGFENSNMKTKLSLASCLSANLKLIAPLVSKTNITMIFLNQTRTNPGVTFGDSTVTAGGNALKFYASLRMKLGKAGKRTVGEKENKVIYAEDVKATIIKNKVYQPWKQVGYVSDFDMGIDLVTSHIEYLKDAGFFGDTQGWLTFDGQKHRQAEVIEKSRADVKFYNTILKAGFQDKEK